MSTTYYSSLETLADAPAATGVWWSSVARALDDLDERLAHEALIDEGPDGALEEAVAREPSLSNRATEAGKELSALVEKSRELRRIVASSAGDPEQVAVVAAELMALAEAEGRYRRRVRSVVWDSLTRDIGGE